jgi:hypothetical protein
MLDAIEPATDLLSAIERWQPGAQVLDAGDEHLDLAVRCYAAAGLSDRQITDRVLGELGIGAPGFERREAAWAIARHCALMDLPLRQIIAVLAHLTAEVPGWPDADENAAIAQAAVAEFA